MTTIVCTGSGSSGGHGGGYSGSSNALSVILQSGGGGGAGGYGSSRWKRWAADPPCGSGYARSGGCGGGGSESGYGGSGGHGGKYTKIHTKDELRITRRRRRMSVSAQPAVSLCQQAAVLQCAEAEVGLHLFVTFQVTCSHLPRRVSVYIQPGLQDWNLQN